MDILLEVSPEIYSNYFVQEKGQSVLYVQMLKVLYGMMVSSLLYYQKVRKDIESTGFEVNPYDMCVANRIIDGNSIQLHGMWMMSSLAMKIVRSVMSF